MDNFKGKIYLSGGGSEIDSYLLDRQFISQLRGNKILYIPIALTGGILTHEAAYSWVINTLTRHSIDFLDITLATDLSLFSDLNNYDGIYIGGGNTYKLLEVIKQTNFDQLLHEFLIKGGDVYGGSAGAIIMGKKIDIVFQENDNNYTQENGLNLAFDHVIACHYNFTHEEDEVFKAYSERTGSNVIALSERSGIVLQGGIMKVIGYDSVNIFIKNKKVGLANGQQIVMK